MNGIVRVVERRRSGCFAVLTSIVTCFVLFAPEGLRADITRVSVASDGTQGNGGSDSFGGPPVSADGRYVAFNSSASNLVPGDTNGRGDVFVHDRETGETTRVSVAGDGTEGNSDSYLGSISADGRYVSFDSAASNLVTGDTNGAHDVFVHDRETGETTRVSVASDGTEANGDYSPLSGSGPVSADGRYVAFGSAASNLVPGDTNGVYDVFVHDRQTGQTTRVSVASDGTQSNDYSLVPPSISADGRHVAFESVATNLVPGDTNGAVDVFVHDRQTGQTTRVSVASDGAEGAGVRPSISADGRYVAFDSSASTLVPGDTNSINDVFVHDRQTGQTTRVSVASSGTAGDLSSVQASINGDGRYVAFESSASNLVPGDTNGAVDVFVHDRHTGETVRVSVAGDGTQGDRSSVQASISTDGRHAAFDSSASTLVPGDTNGLRDVFVSEGFQKPRACLAFLGEDASGSRLEIAVSLSQSGPSGNRLITLDVLSGETLMTQEVPGSAYGVRGVIGITDVSAGGLADLAFLGVDYSAGESKVFVRAGEDGAFVNNQAYLNQEWGSRDLAAIPNQDGQGPDEVAVLAKNNVTGEIAVQFRDSLTGAFTKNVFFLDEFWAPHQLLVLGDLDAIPGQEVGVLATTDAGRIVVMIKNAGTNGFVKNVFFLNANWQPTQALVLRDFAGSAADEIGVLARNRSSGQLVFMVKDAATNTFLNNVFPLGSGWNPIKAVLLPDENANGAEELAVLGVNAGTGKFVIQVRDALTGQFLRNLAPLGPNWDPKDLIVLPDIGGGIPGLSVLATRKTDDLPVVHTFEAISGDLVSNVFLN